VRRRRAPGTPASAAKGDAPANEASEEESPPSADSLIADDIKQRITLARFFASGVADADVALDWVFFKNLLDRCCDKRTDGTGVNASLMVAAAVFAAIGTLLWALAALDMFGWVRYLWFVGRRKQPRFDGYIPRTHMLVANILLEDAPQLVITFVASASSSVALANIVTSLYALFAKLVETLEASRGEYTLPALVSVAPLVRVQMNERRRARDAATTTVNDFVDAAQAIEALIQGRLTDQRLYIADWSALPGSDTTLGKQLRYQLVNNKNMRELRVGDLNAQGMQNFAEVLKANKALQTLELRNNSIGDEGAAALGAALKDNQALQALYLYNNSIGDDAKKRLRQIAQERSTVLELGL